MRNGTEIELTLTDKDANLLWTEYCASGKVGGPTTRVFLSKGKWVTVIYNDIIEGMFPE